MDQITDKLKERYEQLHPLLFHRSWEKAKSDGHLFDLLEGMPTEYPIIWCEQDHCWKHTKDLIQSQNLKKTVDS
jgi:hypothetical protein